MARISTHVLDTSLGRPAEGLAVELYRVSEAERSLLCSAMTNTDGRTPDPLLSAGRIEPGTYELVFHAGAYLRKHHDRLAEPLFLDEITIRFGVSEASGNYHVPLLLSPFAYSIYRGS